jgi:hypothetical protein
MAVRMHGFTSLRIRDAEFPFINLQTGRPTANSLLLLPILSRSNPHVLTCLLNLSNGDPFSFSKTTDPSFLRRKPESASSLHEQHADVTGSALASFQAAFSGTAHGTPL